MGSHPVAVVQYTFTHKQYTEQHNGTEYPEQNIHTVTTSIKGKGLLQQAEVAQGVPGRLRPRIFLTFGTTRVVGRQTYAPAAFTPGEIPGTYF